MKNEKLIKWILRGAWGMYALCVVYFAARHTIWFDEAQAWLLARDSSLIELLFYRMRYEGTPPLWHLMLHPFAHLFPQAWWMMKVIHVSIALCTAALILFRSPFAWYQRILIIFGYFFVFEYAVIARNYAISALLLFCIAHYYNRRTTHIARYVALLVALSQASMFSVCIAIVFCIDLLLQLIQEKKARYAWRVCFVFLINFLFLFLILFPPADLKANVMHNSQINAATILTGVLSRTIFPIPSFSIHFWSLIQHGAGDWYYILGTVGACVMLGIVFYANKRTAVLFFSCTALLLNMMMFVYMGGVRHAGMVYIVFIACIWIMFSDKSKKISHILHDLISMLFTTILFLQAMSGVHALAIATHHPFSLSSQLRHDIADLHLYAQKGIAIFPSFNYAHLSLWKDEGIPELYAIDREDVVSYIVWDRDFYASSTIDDNQLRHELTARMITLSQNMLISFIELDIHNIPDGWRVVRSYSGENTIHIEPAYIYVRE